METHELGNAGGGQIEESDSAEPRTQPLKGPDMISFRKASVSHLF